MYPYYCLLDLPNPLKEGVKLPVSDRNEEIFMFPPRELLNEDLLILLRDVKLIPVGILLFYHKPKYDRQRIHVDGHDGKFVFGINWIFCEDQCMSSWYDVTEEPEIGHSDAKTVVPYIGYSEKNSKLLASTTDKGPFISNASIPHRAQNLGKSDRWCLSLRFFPGLVKSFDEAYSILSPFKRT